MTDPNALTRSFRGGVTELMPPAPERCRQGAAKHESRVRSASYRGSRTIGELAIHSALDWQPVSEPAVEASDDVGRAVEAEIAEGRGGEARAVPVGAEEDDPA